LDSYGPAPDAVTIGHGARRGIAKRALILILSRIAALGPDYKLYLARPRRDRAGPWTAEATHTPRSCGVNPSARSSRRLSTA